MQMHRSIRRIALWMLLCATMASAIVANAQDPRASEAQRAAREWLVLTDADNGEASWQATGKQFRSAISAERWAASLNRARAPLGALVARTLESTQFLKEIPGQPDGDYALLKFRTAFANKSAAEESVTLEREADGVWRVVGYFIR
jgi:hypothetical protein